MTNDRKESRTVDRARSLGVIAASNRNDDFIIETMSESNVRESFNNGSI